MTLDELRRRAANVICIGTLVLAALCVALEWMLQGSLGPATIIAMAAAVVLLVVLALLPNTQAFRYTVMAALMAEVMALVMAARGNDWQVDLHMAFFAALAIGALMCDVKAIILGTVLVAIHHLGLGLLFPELVFYDGGGLGRALLHAAILVVEGVSLGWMAMTTQSLLSFAASKSEEAEREAARVRELAEASEAEREHRAAGRIEMLQRLEASFGRVVAAATAGDLSARSEADFDDPVLDKLATSLNTMMATIERGLTETGAVLAAVAGADLTHRITGDYEGAFGHLKSDTNAVADKLAVIVGNLRETSGALKIATSEILSGANDLSDRTNKQAGTIQETSAAMEQLAHTVAQNAKRANDASEVAATVTRTAEEGGAVMAAANEAMERITTSSQKISSIIGLIDDIAFQTNLLALNASVEAARAGEAGKGFAVVAVEVRRLAQSAAEASKEIKALIDKSGSEVTSGSKLVADAAGKLNAMLAAARASNELMGGIARDSREQAAAIDEVTTAVRQMDEMTQHNAALVEEINASIEQTEAQAHELDHVVDIFSLDGTETFERERAPMSKPEPERATQTPKGGIRVMQERVQQAARTYLTRGNAALDEQWSEF